MITFLILTVIFIIYATTQLTDRDSGVLEYILCLFVGFAMGLMIALPIAISLPMTTYEEPHVIKIENLQDNNSVKGNFFLGCGQINGTMKYVCYYEENGYYQMLQIDYDKAKIKYCDSIPKITILEIKATKDKINLFAIDLDLGEKTYIIEVPKGTIKNNYNLDAQ